MPWAVRDGTRIYVRKSARSHAHQLIHYATASPEISIEARGVTGKQLKAPTKATPRRTQALEPRDTRNA
ncbi:hypothetical protein E2C01_032670 [Portunus trituberculatus]|uniref:Uncharacterized protein n=1 Tax=Portunus trituberculatus TaxID=210409 RepID=A0A5B7F1L7_PORTR|nr:hypothetical protein [Portunus trituberculatus]